MSSRFVAGAKNRVFAEKSRRAGRGKPDLQPKRTSAARAVPPARVEYAARGRERTRVRAPEFAQDWLQAARGSAASLRDLRLRRDPGDLHRSQPANEVRALLG